MDLGLVLPTGAADELGRSSVMDARAAVEGYCDQAEALNVESLWVYDHIVPRTRGSLLFDPIGTLAFAASLTQRAKLGSLVLNCAFRHPLLLVSAFVTLDVVSRGRAILGVGAGWAQEEHEPLGFPFGRSASERTNRLEEYAQILRGLLHGDSVTFSGTWFSLDHASHRPQSWGHEHIPLLMGGNSRAVWRLAIRYADELNLDNLPLPKASASIRSIREMCSREGRPEESLRLSIHLREGEGWLSRVPRRQWLELYRGLEIDRLIVAPAGPVDELVALARELDYD